MRKAFAVLLLALLFVAGCSKAGDDGMLAQADDEYTQGNFLKAESLYERYLEATPQGEGRWQAWERLADIALTVVGDSRKGAAILESALLEYSDNGERAAGILWRLARIYTDLRDWDKATEAWSRLLDEPQTEGGNTWEVYWNLGKIYQFQGRYDMAKDSMLSCMEVAPDGHSKSQCMYELAQAYSFLKNREQSEMWLKKLFDLEEADPELKALSAYLLAELAEADGDIDRARELLESIRETYPNPKVIETRLKHLGQD